MKVRAKIKVKKAVVGNAEVPVLASIPPIPAQDPPTTMHKRVVLDADHCNPTKQLLVKELVIRVVALAQILQEKPFYSYQVEVASRIVESLLLHDMATITALMARQMGKTQVIGTIVAALIIIIPTLAKQFPEDWHLNITDENGVYRGFAYGIKVGIYAPRLDQSGIMFDRVKLALETDKAKQVIREAGLILEVSNGNTIKLSNGSRVLCESASEQSKIEGETHHLLIAEEAQDISDLKMKKSLHPMIAATGGTLVKVGTATTQKCDFYTAIKTNERYFLSYGVKNHFFYPYTVGEKYNSLYRKYIQEEKIKLVENSDEFRTSYCGEWIFERGMFVTQEQLFNIHVAAQYGRWSLRFPRGLPRQLQQYQVVAGIDWGSASDSTVVTLLAVNWNTPIESGETSNSNGQFEYAYYEKHVLDWFEMIGDNYEYQFNVVHDYLTRVFNLRKITTDSNGCGNPIYHRLVSVFASTDVEVEDFNFQAKLKSDGYKSLYGDLCGQRLTFPASEQVRKTIEYHKFHGQLLDLRKNYKNQLMQVAHPDEKDAHDDYADSLMLAAWGANTQSGSSAIQYLSQNIFV